MTKGAQVLVLKDPALPEDHFIMEGIDTSAKGPYFSITEMAKVFFGKSDHWVRKMERLDALVLDGEEVGRRRTEKGARTYLLEDVEKMAHALASKPISSKEKMTLSPEELRRVLHMVRLCAQQHKYLTNEGKPVEHS